MVGEEKAEGKGKGWYTSGAYCESVMKSRRLQYIKVYGKEKGETLWRKWYLGCK